LETECIMDEPTAARHVAETRKVAEA